jgi:serine/threonine protein kinase
MRGLRVLNERSIGKLLVQMVHAIKHLHSCGVAHGDVKPDNFLMGGPEGNTVKLCDYGLSVVMPEAGQLAGVRGTAPYICPEMLRSGWSDDKADVWAIGVVVYLLLCGKFPYQPRSEQWTSQKMQQVIRDGGHAKCERPWLSESATSMLGNMLAREPLLRPTATEALRLPFIGDATLDRKVPEESFLCLRPVLESAFVLGSSQNDPNQKCGLDEYLNSKQRKCHGRVMPSGEPSDMPEPPPREGDWVQAQKDLLSRAMDCNVSEAYGDGMSGTFSDAEKFSSSGLKTPESNGACGSTCSTAVEKTECPQFSVKTCL